jgi:hypothetical protein
MCLPTFSNHLNLETRASIASKMLQDSVKRWARPCTKGGTRGRVTIAYETRGPARPSFIALTSASPWPGCAMTAFNSALACLTEAHDPVEEGAPNQKFSSNDTLELCVFRPTARRRPSGEGTAAQSSRLSPSSTTVALPVRSTFNSAERAPQAPLAR